MTDNSASHQSFWPLFLLNEPPRDSSSLIPRYWLCSNPSSFHKSNFSRFGELLWFWIINRTCEFFFQWTIFRKKITSRILDYAWELYFLIIWMQKLNNFFRQRMGKILSKTRSNWLSCLAWNFVMSHNLCVIVMSYFDSFYFCTNHTRYFIFDIQVWVIFMTHYFDCCIFCDFVIRWQLYDRCFLILLQLLSFKK